MPITLNTPKLAVTLVSLTDQEVFRLLDAFRDLEIFVGSVVITQYENQPAADNFRHQLSKNGITSYIHYPIKGYPTDIDYIVSPEGLGKTNMLKHLVT